ARHRRAISRLNSQIEKREQKFKNAEEEYKAEIVRLERESEEWMDSFQKSEQQRQDEIEQLNLFHHRELGNLKSDHQTELSHQSRLHAQEMQLKDDKIAYLIEHLNAYRDELA